MKKQKSEQLAILKAVRKANREEEIKLHGKPITYHTITKNKKAYDRKKQKAVDQKSLPSLFVFAA